MKDTPLPPPPLPDKVPPDPATATALKLWVVLARASAAVAEHSRLDIEKSGLTQGEFAVLELLYSKGPQLLGEVRKRVLVSSGGTTFLVDRLERRGLVERIPCPTDRRARFAGLTHQGERLMRGIFPPHAQAMKRAVSGLSQAEQRQVTDLLKRLGHHAERILRDPG
jgi:MarR family 2-MHQ and catechol resistance regulon transcriptional repressor